MRNSKGFICANTPASLPPQLQGENTPSNFALKGQSKTSSATESLFNILFGFWVAVLAQVIIFPWFGMEVTLTDNVYISMCFTVVSFARSYALRRFFNMLEVRKVKHGKR